MLKIFLKKISINQKLKQNQMVMNVCSTYLQIEKLMFLHLDVLFW